MKLEDLKDCSVFDKKIELKRRHTLQDSMVSFRRYANGILDAFDYTRDHFDEKETLPYKFAIDSIIANTTSYIESFIDIVGVICIESKEVVKYNISQLRGVINYFTSEFELSDDCMHWVEFLQRRNEIVHAYNDSEYLTEELYNAVLTYTDEIMHVVDIVSDIIKSRSLGDVVVRERLENYDI